MADPLKPVQPGEPLRITAATWNHLLDTSRDRVTDRPMRPSAPRTVVEAVTSGCAPYGSVNRTLSAADAGNQLLTVTPGVAGLYWFTYDLLATGELDEDTVQEWYDFLTGIGATVDNLTRAIFQYWTLSASFPNGSTAATAAAQPHVGSLTYWPGKHYHAATGSLSFPAELAATVGLRFRANIGGLGAGIASEIFALSNFQVTQRVRWVRVAECGTPYTPPPPPPPLIPPPPLPPAPPVPPSPPPPPPPPIIPALDVGCCADVGETFYQIDAAHMPYIRVEIPAGSQQGTYILTWNPETEEYDNSGGDPREPPASGPYIRHFCADIDGEPNNPLWGLNIDGAGVSPMDVGCAPFWAEYYGPTLGVPVGSGNILVFI